MTQRTFSTTISYTDGLFDNITNTTLPLQGDPNYQISVPQKESQLSILLSQFKVLIIEDVPTGVLPFRSFPMQQTKATLLPHQDTTYEDRDDPRVWNLFTNEDRLRENKGGFVFNDHIISDYATLIHEYLEKKPELHEEVLHNLESEIPYTIPKLNQFISGELKEENIIDYFTIAAKLFRNREEVDSFAKEFVQRIANENPSEFLWLKWDKPNTVIIFNNKETYHGRLGGNFGQEEVVLRRWLTNPQ